MNKVIGVFYTLYDNASVVLFWRSQKAQILWTHCEKKDEILEKCIITGMVECTRDSGRFQRAWCDDIKKWTKQSTYELLQSTKHRTARRRGAWSAMPPMLAPATRAPTTNDVRDWPSMILLISYSSANATLLQNISNGLDF